MDRRVAFGALCVLVCAACAQPPETSTGEDDLSIDPNASRGKPKDARAPAPARTAESSTAIPAPVEEAPAPAAEDIVWVGKLATTSKVKFGGLYNGASYCDYTVSFTGLAVKVVTTADGKVKSSEVSGKMVEEAIDCPYEAHPTNLHTYSYVAPTPGALIFSLARGKTNTPWADVDFDGEIRGTSLSATLKIRRNDQPEPFKWVVAASLVLTPTE